MDEGVQGVKPFSIDRGSNEFERLKFAASRLRQPVVSEHAQNLSLLILRRTLSKSNHILHTASDNRQDCHIHRNN